MVRQRRTGFQVILLLNANLYGGPQRQYTNIYFITANYTLVHKHIHRLYEYIYQYNKIRVKR